jgi:hypothetical protein
VILRGAFTVDGLTVGSAFAASDMSFAVGYASSTATIMPPPTTRGLSSCSTASTLAS